MLGQYREPHSSMRSLSTRDRTAGAEADSVAPHALSTRREINRFPGTKCTGKGGNVFDFGPGGGSGSQGVGGGPPSPIPLGPVGTAVQETERKKERATTKKQRVTFDLSTGLRVAAYSIRSPKRETYGMNVRSVPKSSIRYVSTRQRVGSA
eukprot:1775420-Rhodomonas_salina.2